MFLLPVHDVRFHTEDVFELALERRGYPFEPGECAVLYNGGGDSRPYSLCSAPDDPLLRFLIRRIPGGAVSPWLAERQPGDGVRISTPFGQFHPGQGGAPDDPGVFVATGVGISPFLSALRAREAAGGGSAGRAVCLYGVRHAREAVHLEFLRRTTDLRLAVSREAVAGAHHGRVTDLLPQVPFHAGTHFYLCGLDEMVDEVAFWLAGRGVDPRQIHTEVFFLS